jgi:hypothetical protein
MRDDGYAAGVHLHHCRVFISIRHVFGDVFKHELLGVGFHVGAYETGKIEIWSSIEIKLIFEHLVHGIGGCSILWDLELGDLLLAGVAGRVGGYVRGTTMCVNVFAAGLAHMKVVKAMDDLVGVDLCLVRRV